MFALRRVAIVTHLCVICNRFASAAVIAILLLSRVGALTFACFLLGFVFFWGGGSSVLRPDSRRFTYGLSVMVPVVSHSTSRPDRWRFSRLFVLIHFFLCRCRLALPVKLGSVVTPLCSSEFRRELVDHPDRARVNYVCDGIQHGFRTGFCPDLVHLRSSSRNMRSATDHSDVVDAYQDAEVLKGRVIGPFRDLPVPNLHCSPFGVIPKKSQLGKWRLILDLSSPEFHSVNDGIPPDPYSLRYIRVDDAIAALVRLGPGAMMAKFDVEAAYRNIPIHPDQQFLLGMRWREQFFVDLTLPFGLRSAPFIFDSVAALVQWILQRRYRVRFLFHYLDDFLTLGPAGSKECAENVCISRSVFARLGLPLHPTKCEGPTTILVFLGIELDSVLQIARLPREKFLATLQLLQFWSTKAWCTRKELESLCGSLHHVCKVVPPGRSFLRRMLNLLCGFRNPNHPIRLNLDFKRDLAWWLEFFGEWNGVSFFRMSSVTSLPDLYVASDSSGSCGFGAVCGNAWFYGGWPFDLSPTSITVLELLPIVVAAHLWGFQWVRLQVEFLCDNQAVVAILNSGSSRDPPAMHLMRRLTLVACWHNFSFSARHVPGRCNATADALSRFQFQDFHRLLPTANTHPTAVPSQLIQELLFAT